MATFKISGVWKNENNVITDYAFHTVGEKSISRAVKVSKSKAIELLEIRGNSAKTWIWNYNLAKFVDGQNVEVVGITNKYLRSDPDNKLTDNLGHLIDFDWIKQ